MDRFNKKNVEYIEIEPVKENDFLLLEKYKPDLIITSATSLPFKDMSEKYLWQNAKKKSIPTIAMLDQWQNYSIRFSGAEEKEKLKYLPDYINCLNAIGKTEMVAEGFPAEILFEFGQPYLSLINNDSYDIENIKKKIGITGNGKVILFVSEPIKEHFGNKRGYDQYKVFEISS